MTEKYENRRLGAAVNIHDFGRIARFLKTNKTSLKKYQIDFWNNVLYVEVQKKLFVIFYIRCAFSFKIKYDRLKPNSLLFFR